MNNAVKMERLTVWRRNMVILDDVSLTLAGGAFLAVLGPNGAGKTTMLNAILGFARFTGYLEVLGSDVTGLSAFGWGKLRKRIGYVPQLQARTSYVTPLSIREVVEMGRAGVRGLARPLGPEDRQICSEVMRQLGLLSLADRPFAVLSGGEQRKVHLARALAQQPDLLLLDEPAGHLDLRWQEVITQLIGRVWRTTRITVIMVTHDPRHLPSGVTHTAVLSSGRLIGIGTLVEAMDAKRLSELYGLPLRVSEAEGRYLVLPENLM